MEDLIKDKKSKAWDATWTPSLAGKANLRLDGSFWEVNPEFAEMLGVTPGELLDKKYHDITPPDLREVEEKNVQLMIEGRQKNFILNKEFDFGGGHIVPVVLMAHRVPGQLQEECEFFTVEILLDESSKPESPIPSDTKSQSKRPDINWYAVGGAIGLLLIGILAKFGITVIE